MLLQLSPFKKALLASLAAHTMLFLNAPEIREPRKVVISDKNIEVTYYEIKGGMKPEPKAQAVIRPPQIKAPPAASARRPTGYVEERAISRPVAEGPGSASLRVPESTGLRGKGDNVSIKEGPVLPKDEELTKEKKEAFLDYYQIIRERLRAEAERNFIGYFAEGNIYLAFALARDGRLIEAKILEGSSPTEYLREISIKSLRDASPYPPFPPKLKQEEIYFNVIISFELEAVE